MKSFWTLILLATFLWSSPVVAEFCTQGSEGKSTSCIFKTKRNPKDAQVVVSYTQQGWSMMVAVFLKKDFAMVSGDSRVTTKSGETFELEYISTRRDLTLDRRMMEAPVYLVSEELLHALSNTKGKVRFWLSAEKPKELEVEFSSGLFEDLDAYVAETRTVLSELFDDQ
jgi:hypothetical protein